MCLQVGPLTPPWAALLTQLQMAPLAAWPLGVVPLELCSAQLTQLYLAILAPTAAVIPGGTQAPLPQRLLCLQGTLS